MNIGANLLAPITKRLVMRACHSAFHKVRKEPMQLGIKDLVDSIGSANIDDMMDVAVAIMLRKSAAIPLGRSIVAEEHLAHVVVDTNSGKSSIAKKRTDSEPIKPAEP